jgi:hypothetical protein
MDGMFGRRRRIERSRGQAARQIQMLVQSTGESPFGLMVEPEAMEYEFPPHQKVLLTFVIPDRDIQYFDIAHAPDYLTIWRPGDTEVWATLADGSRTQIGGFRDNPAPWLDSGGDLPASEAPWSWPPPPSST